MKKLLLGLGVVVVLIIIALIAIPFLVPVDTYKGKLIALVKSETGRDLTISGPVKLSLLPSLAIEANDVAFSNAPGGAAKQMAQLKTLQIALRVFPLLHGEVAVDRFVLIEPVIALEVDKEGKANWSFGKTAPAGAAPAKPAAAPSAGGGASLANLSLDDVRLVNGTISYLDQRTGKKQEVSAINMKLALPDLASQFAAEGSAVWNGEKLNLSADVDKPGALAGGGTSPLGFKLASNPVNVSFSGNATGATLQKLTGNVDLAVPSLRGLAKWVGTPINAPGNGFGPLAIKGNLDMAGSKIAFSDADIAVDAIKAKGAVEVDTGGARPYLRGKLAVDQLDVNPYLPPEQPAGAPGKAAGRSATPAATPASSGWSDDPIDVSALKTADLDFDLSANGIKYRKIQIGKSALALHLKDGHFTADLNQLELYKGSGKGKFAVDGSGAVPGVDANFNLANVAIEPLLVDLMGMDKLSGTGAFDIAVTGKGKSQRELISALNGKGSLNLGQGVYKGANILAMVRQAASSLKNSAASLVGAGSGNSQDTEFSSLTGTYTIANGVIHNTDLLLKSADVPMTGTGTIDLPKRSVDYRVTPKLEGALAIPVNVKGPWDNISYQPDLAAIVGDPAKLLGGAAQGLGGAAGNLLGGGNSGSGGANTGSSSTGSSNAGDAAKNVGNALKGLLGK